MITGKYFEDRPDYEEFTCSDGTVFRVDYDKVYRNAMNHERDYCNAQLAKCVDVVYDILKDTNENPEEECCSIPEFIDKKMDYGNQKILYIMRLKGNIDPDEAFNACRAWYDYLIATTGANYMTDPIVSNADHMTRYESVHISEHKFNQFTRKAYVIKGSVSREDGAVMFWLTTAEDMQRFSDDARRLYDNKLNTLDKVDELLKSIEVD